MSSLHKDDCHYYKEKGCWKNICSTLASKDQKKKRTNIDIRTSLCESTCSGQSIRAFNTKKELFMRL